MQHFPVTFDEKSFDSDHLDTAELEKIAADAIIKAFKDKITRERSKLPSLPPGVTLPDPIANAVRNIMIRKNDQLWQEHLLAMDHLRAEVNLRALGQRDPLMEFKHEAFATFDAFSKQLYIEISQGLFRFQIVFQQSPPLEELLKRLQMETNRSLYADIAAPEAANTAADQLEEIAEDEYLEPIVNGPKQGRNDLCPCGSGKKYKKCCGTQSGDDEV
jgi:preprotein translocase subunit SecA